MDGEPESGNGETPQTRPRSRGGLALGVVGIVLHCTVVAWYYLASGLIVPAYGLLLLFVIWLTLLALGIRWVRSPVPARALATPFLAAVAWVAILFLGGRLLGWSP